MTAFYTREGSHRQHNCMDQVRGRSTGAKVTGSLAQSLVQWLSHRLTGTVGFNGTVTGSHSSMRLGHMHRTGNNALDCVKRMHEAAQARQSLFLQFCTNDGSKASCSIPTRCRGCSAKHRNAALWLRGWPFHH
eukprot:1155276-Pelagomonas_calceolata.AAC.1